MRLGPFVIRVAPSMWLGFGWHFTQTNGMRLLVTVAPNRAVFGSGFVVSWLGLMLWVTRDEMVVLL